MKLLIFFTCFMVISSSLLAQSAYQSIQVNHVDSLDNVIHSKEYKDWDEVRADTTLKGINYNTVVRDIHGRLVTPKLKNKVIRSISINPKSNNILYAGIKGYSAGDARVAMSMDFGNSWTYMNRGKSLSEEAADVQTIEASPHNKHVIYAGTWKHGLFRSTDAGNEFIKLSNFPSIDVRAIIFNPKNEHHILIATTSHGVVETLDNGETWITKDADYLESNFISLWGLVQSPYNPNELYAMSIRQGLHKSENFGKDWKKMIDDPEKIIFGLGFRNEQEIWCSSTDFKSGSLYYSNDSGDSFTLREGPFSDTIGSFVTVNKSRTESEFYLGGRNGLYVLKDDEIQDSNIALPSPVLAHLLEVDHKLLIATWGEGLIILD